MDDLHLAIRSTTNTTGGRHRLRDDIEPLPQPRTAGPTVAVFGIPPTVVIVLALTLAALFAALVIA